MFVPGANLLSMAFSVIGQQTVEWRRYLGQTTNAAGLKVEQWADPVPLAGSLQPVDSALMQQLGLDWTRNYATFYAAASVGDVGRDRTGDKLTWKGRTYQVLDKTDWYFQDGWGRVLCVQIDYTPSVSPATIASTSAVLGSDDMSINISQYVEITSGVGGTPGGGAGVFIPAVDTSVLVPLIASTVAVVAPVVTDGLPSPPTGFLYLVASDGAYLTASDGAYLLEAA